MMACRSPQYIYAHGGRQWRPRSPVNLFFSVSVLSYGYPAGAASEGTAGIMHMPFVPRSCQSLTG